MTVIALTALAPNGVNRWALIVPSYRSHVRLLSLPAATEWILPSHLDTGQARTNSYHHPEEILVPDDDETE